jgi:hypothetical protein
LAKGKDTSFFKNHEIIDEAKYRWKLFQFPNANSLFECFFKTFPKIADVDTENIGELGFKNPFNYLHEPNENPEYNMYKINKETFFKQTQRCNNSKDFHAKWDDLKKTEIPKEIQVF